MKKREREVLSFSMAVIPENSQQNNIQRTSKPAWERKMKPSPPSGLGQQRADWPVGRPAITTSMQTPLAAGANTAVSGQVRGVP